jgi:hypothetical protein
MVTFLISKVVRFTLYAHLSLHFGGCPKGKLFVTTDLVRGLALFCCRAWHTSRVCRVCAISKRGLKRIAFYFSPSSLGSLRNNIVNPPTTNTPSSDKELLPNQTKTKQVIKTTEPMIVVLRLRNNRSIIVCLFCVIRAGTECQDTFCKSASPTKRWRKLRRSPTKLGS